MSAGGAAGWLPRGCKVRKLPNDTCRELACADKRAANAASSGVVSPATGAGIVALVTIGSGGRAMAAAPVPAGIAMAGAAAACPLFMNQLSLAAAGCLALA